MGLLELGTVGVLLAFLFLNREPVHAVVAWAAPLGFLPGVLHAWRAVTRRRAGASAGRRWRWRITADHRRWARRGIAGAAARSLAEYQPAHRAARPDAPGAVARTRVRWPEAARFYRALAAAPDAATPPGRWPGCGQSRAAEDRLRSR